jgi:hypothetical protein
VVNISFPKAENQESCVVPLLLVTPVTQNCVTDKSSRFIMEARQTALCPGGRIIIMFRQPWILVTFQMAYVMGVF